MHPDVDKVAFTGSTEVGRLILGGGREESQEVSLELGGKSHHIVCKDADLEASIPGVASAIFFNPGQCRCQAPGGERLHLWPGGGGVDPRCREGPPRRG